MSEDDNQNMENNVGEIPIRQNMVTTAVNFLLNPDVHTRPENSKVAFLKKKGLTDSEISAAFDKIKCDPSFISSPNATGQLIPPVPPSYPPKTYSVWSKLSGFSTSLIVVAVALYGLHRFYKLYIEPFLFDTKVENELTPLEAQLLKLDDSVIQLKNAVSSLEKNIQSQSEQVERTLLTENSAYMPIPMALADLKTEVGSLKSLLINRHQFPMPPKVTSNPSIPLWQLPASESESAAPESVPSVDDPQVEAPPTNPDSPQTVADISDPGSQISELSEESHFKSQENNGSGTVNGTKKNIAVRTKTSNSVPETDSKTDQASVESLSKTSSVKTVNGKAADSAKLITNGMNGSHSKNV